MLSLISACIALTLPQPVAPSFAASPSAAQQEAELPQWIWSAGEPGDDQDVFFLRDVELSGELVGAKLEASCDNSIELFVNGEQVALSDEWQVALRIDVKERLHAGERNRLAINGWNQNGPAGLWLSLELTYADGRVETILSDSEWMVLSEERDGWSERGFAPEGWSKAVELGQLGIDPWGLPLSTTDGKPPRALEAREVEAAAGFVVELVYNVPRTTQGSWVSMAAAPGGKLFVCDQYGSLYSVTPSATGAGEAGTQVERIDVEVGEAQGLLWAFDALYVVGGTSGSGDAGLYRVTDSDGDGGLDNVELLRALDGWGEHGPHAVVLSPDGESLYLVAGNHTTLTEISSSRVPQIWGEDQLLPRLPDPRGHAVGKMAPSGWVCEVDRDGKQWELVACGMRNAYDIAFNEAGELFTFDSDMEWDVGLPWYRPTRVLHLVGGADFGWRHGSGKWPANYADSWPGVVDVGLGSPTGIVFAPASWGEVWGDTLLVADWAYGQVHAVNLVMQGASYTGELSEFLSGKPFPVTDLVVMDDALYVTTGGRRVQSGLYRVTASAGVQARNDSSANGSVRSASIADPALASRRHEVEASFFQPEKLKLEALWTLLASEDQHVQRAARVALEHRPLESWQARAESEDDPRIAIQAMIALARVKGAALGETADASHAIPLHTRWLQLPFAELDQRDKHDALRLFGLITTRLGEPSELNKRRTAELLDTQFPSGDDHLDRELCRVLVSVDAPYVVERSLSLIDLATTQEERIFYFYALRCASEGWTQESRETFFLAIQLAIRDFEGGASLTQYLQVIRDAASEALTAEQRVALSPYLIELEKPATPPSRLRSFVKSWKSADLASKAMELADRDRTRGQALLDEATCLSCHRFGGAGGNTGPDFTGAGSRFNARDLLEAMLDPSAQISDQYQDTEIYTTDEELFVGRVEGEEGEVVLLRTLPPQDELLEFNEDEIAIRRPHALSRMPKGLLDTYDEGEILDMLAALIAGPLE